MPKKAAEKTEKEDKRKTSKKMGRPRVSFDFRQLDELCKLHCTKDEIANILGVSLKSLERRIFEETGLTFGSYFKQKSSHGKRSLRKKIRDMAESGHWGAAQHLARHWLGEWDKQEVEINIKPTIIETVDGTPALELGITQQVEDLKEVGEGTEDEDEDYS